MAIVPTYGGNSTRGFHRVLAMSGAFAPPGAVPDVIGVVGAGTMGAGIAQLAAQAGARTLLYDRGARGAGAWDGKRSRRGWLAWWSEASSRRPGRAARDRVEAISSPAELTSCGIVIEAAPERIELKLELFGPSWLDRSAQTASWPPTPHRCR